MNLRIPLIIKFSKKKSKQPKKKEMANSFQETLLPFCSIYTKVYDDMVSGDTWSGGQE